MIEFLRISGYDISSVIEEKLSGKSDEYLIKYAFRQKSIIITHDSDFGKIIFTQQINFTGIIYLRPGHFNPNVTITTLKTLLSRQAEVKIPFLIVAENLIDNIKIRVREF